MLTALELDALLLSLQIALAAVTVSLPLAVAVAWVLARARFPGKSLLDAAVHLPLVLPPVVVGYFLLLLFGSQGPLGAGLQEWFGLRLVFTRWGAALAAAVMSFPLMVRAIRLALEAVDRGLEQAARTLGASRLDVFLTVTLPLMLPGILSGCVVAFAAALGDFGATITFAGNVEGRTQTLPLAVYLLLERNQGAAYSLSAVLVGVAVAVLVLLRGRWLGVRR